MGEPLTVIARLRAKAGQQARLRQQLQGLVAPSRAEAGCLLYDLHESRSDSGLFLFYEIWKSDADLDAHFQTPHIKAIGKLFPELLDGELDLTKWTKL
jgi:quinol monooxygenase YgiN